MSDDISDIAAYYNNDPEREHSRLERHQLEYDLTWRYLNQYLPKQGRILEIGAATGRYTVELARRGYAVTAVDMSTGLLEESRKRIADEQLEDCVKFIAADGRDLSAVTERDFDVALLMGPLYHLVDQTDRRTVLKEASQRLCQGGILFSAFISRFAILSDLIKNVPNWVESRAEVRSILERGRSPEDFPRGGFRGYFVRTSELAPMHEEMGFETLTVAGVEPAIGADDESYNKLEGPLRQLWLDLLYEISTESSIMGASRHLLYIGRKK